MSSSLQIRKSDVAGLTFDDLLVILTPLQFSKVSIDTETGCWIWGGGKNNSGYACIWNNKKSNSGHILVYEYFIGTVPENLQLDHTCHDPSVCRKGVKCKHRACINPLHMEPVTSLENTRRGGRVGKQPIETICRKGLHELNEENTYVAPDGSRRCRPCGTETSRRIRNRRAS